GGRQRRWRTAPGSAQPPGATGGAGGARFLIVANTGYLNMFRLLLADEFEFSGPNGVMGEELRRSRGVTETLTLAVPTARARPTLDFDELYRANREDLYAYVATLVGDRSL